MVRYAGEQIFEQANANVNKNVWGNIIYNVKAYGAKGDGVTDDSTAIQAAISAANTAGGGKVFFPAGTYLISTQLNLFSNVSFEGVGNASVIKAKDSFATTNLSPMIWADSQSDISIRELTIDGNGANQTGTANIVGIGGYKCTRYIIEDSHIKNTYGYSIELSNCIYSSVESNIVETTFNQYAGIVLTADTANYFNAYSIINDNIIYGVMADAISVTGSATGNITNVDIVGNTIFNCGFMGNNVDGAAVYMNYAGNCTADGNTVDKIGGNAMDIYIAKNIVASNNVISNVDRAGIMLDTVTYSQVTGNIVTNCVKKGATDPFNQSHGFISGLYAGDSCQHISFTNNISTDNQTTKTQQYGLLTSGTVNSNFIITGNELSGNAVGGILFNNPVATCFTKTNIGYNPVGKITSPAIPTSGTNYTNAFPYTVRVFVVGSAVTGLYINGQSVGVTGTAVTNGLMLILDPGETIKLDYSSAPSWNWFGM